MNRTFILRDPINRATLYKFLDDPQMGWEASARAGKPLQVDIGMEKQKRSLQALRYYWAMLNQASEQIWIEGKVYPSAVYHELAKRRFLGCIDLPGGGLVALSSSDLNPKEFALFVENTEAWLATEFGVTFLEHEP